MECVVAEINTLAGVSQGHPPQICTPIIVSQPPGAVCISAGICATLAMCTLFKARRCVTVREAGCHHHTHQQTHWCPLSPCMAGDHGLSLNDCLHIIIGWNGAKYSNSVEKSADTVCTQPVRHRLFRYQLFYQTDLVCATM